jgi:hypothetical protein
MDVEPFVLSTNQRTLFEFGGQSSETIEITSIIWKAAEALTSAEIETRGSGLSRLVEFNAIRLSPLIAYLVATRLIEPEISLRVRLVTALGDVLRVDKEGKTAPDSVRQSLGNFLTQMRTREIFALLQAAAFDSRIEPDISSLLRLSPYSGKQMADIMADRKMPIEMRCLAGHFIGKIGYIEAIPTLERLLGRLEALLCGKPASYYVTSNAKDESILLPIIQEVLALLQAP